MDANLAPLMMGLLAAFLAGMGYIVFSAWRLQRAVAWNVVNAVLTLRQLPPEQKALFEQGVGDALKQFHLSPEQLQRAEPAVRYALYADALRRQRIVALGEAKPFKVLRSPLLARSATSQIQFARLQAEMQHATVLTELDAAPA